MWLYLGAASVIVFTGLVWNKIPSFQNTITSINHIRGVTSEVYNVIKQHGIGICLLWTKQVITNHIGKRLVEMHHKYYIIHYPYGVTWYKIVIPRKRGPSMVDTISDQTGNNVKKDILAYMGPSRNFHGTNITPKMMGYEKLTFTSIDGSTKQFDSNEYITI